MLQGMRKSQLYGIEPACRNVSLVNANFSVNQMSPIICNIIIIWWNIFIIFETINRSTKDNKKIKLRGLKASCVTIISYRISHNFPALERWNEVWS